MINDGKKNKRKGKKTRQQSIIKILKKKVAIIQLMNIDDNLNLSRFFSREYDQNFLQESSYDD